jgi:uncharacterized membrane protein YeaQ/YmgE (transglycosylase-associated protein family)
VIGWIIFGLIIGALARLLMPGPQPIGILATMAVGIAGSFIGGFVAYLLFGGEPLQASGWIGSLIGAVLLLAIVSYANGRRQRRVF